LSRQLAESGHYPAIDIEASISRVMPEITDAEHQQRAQSFKKMVSLYEQNKDLITVGAYQPGTNQRIDEAIDFNPRLMGFLQQHMHESVDYDQSKAQMSELMAEPA